MGDRFGAGASRDKAQKKLSKKIHNPGQSSFKKTGGPAIRRGAAAAGRGAVKQIKKRLQK